MAQPIGDKACLISLTAAYSVENGASNRGEVLFKNKVS
jgi:hypothetical protein